MQYRQLVYARRSQYAPFLLGELLYINGKMAAVEFFTPFAEGWDLMGEAHDKCGYYLERRFVKPITGREEIERLYYEGKIGQRSYEISIARLEQ
jgi:hypothetical protein